MIHGCFRLIGILLALGLFFSGANVGIQALLALPPLEELSHASGTLKSVSTCSEGRNREYRYVVQSQGSELTVRGSCPSERHRTLARSVGQAIELRYSEHRGVLFKKYVTVRDLRLEGRALDTYAESLAHKDKVRWFLMLMCLGMMVCSVLMLKAVLPTGPFAAWLWPFKSDTP